MTSGSGRPRLLIYSQDGLGLGHLRRTTLLAAQFLRASPEANVLTVCDSPAGPFFTPPPGHDHIKLPSVRKLRPGEWSAVSLSLSFPAVLDLRKEMIRTTALSFDPDVLLVDHMPHGAMGELLPTLKALSSRPVRIVLGLRDILDAPETIRRRWHLEGAFEAVRQYFDDVLVYGSQDVFDVAASYGWPEELLDRVQYCGYICSSAPVPEADSVRSEHLDGSPDGELVVAMAGGGADASPLFETLLRSVPAITAQRRCSFVVITGPFLPEPERARLEELAQGHPVRILTTVPDSLEFLAAADLVVAMAGYNTTAEILKVGAPALLVPRPGPSAEQTMRASRLADRGWVRWLPPDSLSADTLAEAVTDTLANPRLEPPRGPDLLGLQRAARHLVDGTTAELRRERVLPAIIAPPPRHRAAALDEG